MIVPGATVCCIGFGEAGGILGAQLARRGCLVRAWDIPLDDAASRNRLLQEATALRQEGLVEAMAAAGLDYASLAASDGFSWQRLADALAAR